MKLSVARLKSFDYKQFGIDHGEKLGVALVGVLLALALLDTTWQRFEGSPEELTRKAEDAKAKVTTQEWPKAEAAALSQGGDQLVTRVEKMITPIDGSRYKIIQAFNTSIQQEKSRFTQPRWFPVKKLVADFAVAPVVLNPDVPPLKEEFVRKNQPKDKDEKKKDRTPKTKPTQVVAGTKKGKGKKEAAKDGDKVVSEEFQPRAGATKKGNNEPLITMGMGNRLDEERRLDREMRQRVQEDKVIAKKQHQNARGYRFVAVRGVFPLYEQEVELLRAMGEPQTNVKRVRDRIEIDDFKLERQTQQPGPDPWSGPWEIVDKDSVYDLYKNDISGYADETIALGVIDDTISMPYPERLFGKWGELARHPDIKNFELTEEEIEYQVEFERKVIEKFKDQMDKMKPKTDKKGFAGFTQDFRKIRRMTGAADAKSITDEIVDELSSKNPDQEKINEKLKDYVKKHVKPSDRMLLFRYLDFTVVPGKTYRYRVTLVLKNPFLDNSPQDVADPSMIQGKSRETEPSEPTAPIYVPEDARFYMTRASAKIGQAGGKLPEVDLDLYQWFASTGTVVNQIMHTQLGQMIGGRRNAKVLRPAEESNENEDVPFSTKRTLLDVAQGFSLDNPTLYSDIVTDLGAPPPGTKRAMNVPDEAIVVDENGNLSLLDAYEQEPDHQLMKVRYADQQTLAEYFQRADTDVSSLRGANPLKQLDDKKDDPRRSKFRNMGAPRGRGGRGGE
jgi:hypothetical protein